ncbi:electron transfer flavoprotein subunit alpha/FixB family protein [Bartonella tribocorum]|uniref:Electron transfer flavoprotein subunit alpha n=1 Tax=Bartonella tribocorum (strain DSM 28219 / CCUG 45778 / CIP 105476 / IBS 506) TaxID=382640 RepID=A9IXC2_BART1|nr:electron transfer flavoprotein subunit alpha/FixB family protein [Bartonella tribocorum]CAK02147.1 electron transfer flavoprotein alpha-subunit [Bartonella tribocorum CIP 105476]CDO49414.1 electron transfer flavoprotein alpha subunit [Bartonella tribocorum]
MAILLLADHNTEETAKALTAAHALKSDIDILVCGENIQTIAEKSAKLNGVRQVLIAEADYLAHQLAEPMADTIISLANDNDYDVIMAPSSSTGKNVMPRIAALLDLMQISDITAVLSPDTFKRPIYAGNAVETVRSNDPKKIITVRTASFTPTASQNNSAPIKTITPAPNPNLSSFVKAEANKNDRPDLTSARVIISGGRGLGSQEKFMALLLPLANKLNAALGASRAAVDAGYAPNDWQIGQTGKVVAPELYIAVGISGAIQHLAGIMDAQIIVAINKDEEAPIMQIADYALVGDLHQIIPELEKAL